MAAADCKEPSSDEWAETYLVQRDMADSLRFDIQIQALQALSQLPHSGFNARKALLQSDFLQYLVGQLGHEAEDIHRCALSGIANMLEYGDNPPDTVYDVDVFLTENFFELTQSETRQVVRECYRVIQALFHNPNSTFLTLHNQTHRPSTFALSSPPMLTPVVCSNITFALQHDTLYKATGLSGIMPTK